MTAHAGTAFIDIRGDFSSLDKQIDGVAKGTKGKFSAIGKAAAIGIGAGIGAAAVAVKGFVDAAVESEKSQARMETQLKSMGSSFKAHASDIDRVIQKHSRLAGLDDEDLQDAFTNIARSSGDVSKALKYTGLAADIARAKHMDVAKAGELVGKVAGGNTGILGRYGIKIKEGATATEALGALQGKFAGQAEAYGKTTAGAQDRFRVAVENLQEKLGQYLLPMVSKVAGAVTEFVTGIENGTGAGGRFRDIVMGVVDALKGSFEWIVKNKDILIPIAVVIASAAAAFGIYTAATTAAAFATGAFNAVLAANPVTLVVIAIGALVAALVIAYQKSEAFRNIVDAVGAALKTAVVAVVGFVTDVDAIPGKLLSAGNAIVNALVEGIKALPGALVDAARWIFNHIDDAIRLEIQAWSTVGKFLLDRIVDLVKALPGLLIDLGKWVLNRFADGFMAMTELFAGAGKWLLGKVVELVKATPGALVDLGVWSLNRVADGFMTVTDLLGGAGEWLAKKIVGLVKDIPNTFKDLGGWIVDKIVDGLKAGGNLVVDFLNEIIKAINLLPGVEFKLIPGLATGGTFTREGVEPGYARGGIVRRPQVLVGEEAPRHPEFVIPTNPAYRGRALALYDRLGQQLLPGFKEGGVLGSVGGVLVDGAKAILSKLPSPGKMLPGWLTGLGAEVITQITKWIKDKASSLLPDLPDIGGSIGGGQSMMWKVVEALAAKLGLQMTSGTRGPRFVGDTSLHIAGRARDYSNSTGPTPEMMTFAQTLSRAIGSKLLELIYTPLNYSIKNGAQVAPYSQAEHYNHVHVAMATGGMFSRAGAITGPFVGSYKLGGIVPRDGLAHVHAGETITPAGAGPIYADIYIGGEKIDERVEVKIRDNDRRQAGAYRAGVLA